MVSRLPRIRRLYRSVYSSRAELLYCRRFAKNQVQKAKAQGINPGRKLTQIGKLTRYAMR